MVGPELQKRARKERTPEPPVANMTFLSVGWWSISQSPLAVSEYQHILVELKSFCASLGKNFPALRKGGQRDELVKP